MHLHTLDIAIIVCYFVGIILLGLWVSRRGAKDMDSYFLGGKIAAVVFAGHFRRLGHVRYQRHDVAGLSCCLSMA